MDQSLATAATRNLDELFHHLFEQSRRAQTVSLAERLDRLSRLRELVRVNERRFREAISADFGHRSITETTIAETLMVFAEIKHASKKLKRWMAPQRIRTEPQYWPGRNVLMPQPLGVIGIIAPWNYPLQLTLVPAIAAIAAGNRVMIKPSELVPRFAALLQETVASAFDASEFAVSGIEDGVAAHFANLPFDHLLFTGSTRVGRLVAEAAGRNLTPVTLELGGKSPAIIDRSADLTRAAERIAYGKLFNAGQTCIAPDYVLAPRESVGQFASLVQDAMKRMFGSRPDNPDYTSIVSDRHYARLETMAADAATHGAQIMQPSSPADPAWKSTRRFPPTLIVNGTAEMQVMQEEIFGPILPIVGYDNAGDAIAHVNAHDRPLALYWFGTDAAQRDAVLSQTISGGVTVNDCLFHFVQINQPMGGVGPSGMGMYHGEWGFRTFSKLKPVFYRPRLSRLHDLYPPYGAKIARLEKLLRLLS